MNKAKLLIAACALMIGATATWAQTDYVSHVKTTWKGQSGTTTGNGIALAELYNSSSAGVKLSQVVTGIDNGIYELVVYATSHNARGEDGATLNGTRDDLSYIFATTGDETKRTFFTAVGVEPGFRSGEPYEVTVSDIAVTDNSMTIGLALTESKVTGWHTIQIKSLVRTGELSLSAMAEAYESVADKADSLAATSDKIAANVLASLNEAITTYGEGKVDKTDAVALETAINALKKASDLAETSIRSYKIIASGVVSTDAIDGWVCENSDNFQVNTWSTEGEFDGTGMTNTVNGSSTTNFIENWVGRANVLGDGKVYYQLAGLQPGETYYAQALVRAYSEAGNIPNGPNFFVNNTITDMTTNGSEFEYQGMRGYYGVLGGVGTVGEEGVITIGVIHEDANYNWVAFKNVSIQSMDDALETAVGKVASLEGKVPASVYDIAYETVEAYTGDNRPSTAKEFEVAIAAIEEAALKAQPFVKSYEAWLEVKAAAEKLFVGKEALMEVLMSESDVVEYATDVSEVTSSTERIANLNRSVRAWNDMKALADALLATPNDNAAANEEFAASVATLTEEMEYTDDESYVDEVTLGLRSAMVTYVGMANPVDGHQFDLTFLFVNPDLTGLGNGQKEGWFTDQNELTQSSQAMTTNMEIACSEDATMYAMYEYWSSNTEATEGFTAYQNIFLSKGYYCVSAYCMAAYGNGAVYSDPTTKNVTLSAGALDGDKITSVTLEKTMLAFMQDEDGELKIGLKAHEGNTANWMGIGYLHLYKMADGRGTGIAPTDSGRLHTRGEVYDLQGRRVNPSALEKGIYIINGKKVAVE